MSSENFTPPKDPSRALVTSALPYANGPIHFGHIAGAYLPADIYVRTRRARGHDIVYICGTDEHGVAITLSALRAGISPRETVDRWNRVIVDVFKKFEISFDHFSRTATDKHAGVSQEIFRQLVDNNLVAPQDSEQLYCVQDKMFLPDRYVTGVCHDCEFPQARGDECPRCGAWIDPLRLTDPACKMCGSTPEKKVTRHWYLLLDQLQERLDRFIGARSHWKRNVLSFVNGLLKEGLKPRPVTRDLEWGIPVPLEEARGKVIYVWFDAPIGYITATQEWAEQQGTPERWKDYWQRPDTQIVHFIGKDNIPFHCLTFPAMLMGQSDDWTLAADVPANEFFNLEGGKFNTSAGWYIDLDDFFSKYSTDMIRWSIARNLPETSDSEFTWSDFQAKVNGELNDIYGNLAHRVQTFIHRYFDGVIPGRTRAGAAEEELMQVRRGAPGRVALAVEEFRLRDGAREVMNLAREGNRYFDAAAPWKTRKTDLEVCGAALNTCISLLETLAVISAPYIPGAADRLWKMIGCAGEVSRVAWDEAGDLPDPAGRSLQEARPLFNKIEDSVIQAEIEALHAQAKQADAGAGEKAMSEENTTPAGETEGTEAEGNTAAPEVAPEAAGAATGLPELRSEITIDDFIKCDFRLGKILDAEKVPGSKRLLKFTIDIGIDTRTILAGIQEHYPPEDLVGKMVVVIANLAPRRMMGYDSQGMVLAAEVDGKLTVLTPFSDGLKPGAQLS